MCGKLDYTRYSCSHTRPLRRCKTTATFTPFMPKTAPQIVYGPTLNGEDLLWIFRKQKTQEKRRFVKVHDSFIVSLIDEALKPDALVWLNKARLAGAHLALTVRGASYPGAASTLIAWRPKIRKLLKGNRRANSITDEDRIINLRKNFHPGRATKDKSRVWPIGTPAKR